MKQLILNVERFLRFFLSLTPDQRQLQQMELSEAAQALADELEDLAETLPDEPQEKGKEQ